MKLSVVYVFQIDNRFPQLVIIIKQWAHVADIADPSQNTFSGFCLSLLVLFFLQKIAPPALPNLQHQFRSLFNDRIPVEDLDYDHKISRQVEKSSNTQSVGELLIESFLHKPCHV